MFSRFDVWQYRPDANCWDFVREFLLEKAGVPADDIPRFGIAPNDKKNMTIAANSVKKTFVESGPVNYAVACHYYGKTIIHVGVIDGDIVRHTGSQFGTLKSTIDEFESMGKKTIYRLHKSLWQH